MFRFIALLARVWERSLGAFNAAGYDADELEDLFLENNWGEIIRGDIPRRAKTLPSKRTRKSKLFWLTSPVSMMV